MAQSSWAYSRCATSCGCGRGTERAARCRAKRPQRPEFAPGAVIQGAPDVRRSMVSEVAVRVLAPTRITQPDKMSFGLRLRLRGAAVGALRRRSDAELMALARAGDPDAFEVIYERHSVA